MMTSNALSIWGQLVPLTASEAEQMLQSHIPAWKLRMDGVVLAANPTALWLWGALAPHGTRTQSAVIGQSVFTIIARNLNRIPVRQNRTFFAAKFRIEHFTLGDDPASPLAEARKRDAELQRLYEHTDRANLADVWDFVLKIRDPEDSGGEHFLTFRASVRPIASETGQPLGFLARYQPYGDASVVLDRVYEVLGRQLDKQVHYRRASGVRRSSKHVDMSEDLGAQAAMMDQSSGAKVDVRDPELQWRGFLGPVLTENDVQRRLMLPDSRLVNSLRDAKHLLALHTKDGQLIYPAFQFTHDAGPHPIISSVLRTFAEVFEQEGSAEFMAASWLQTPQDEFGGETPMHWLEHGGTPESVIDAARMTADRFAH